MGEEQEPHWVAFEDVILCYPPGIIPGKGHAELREG